MVPSCARCESSAIESGYFFYSLTSQVRVQFREVNIQEGLSKQKNVDSKTSGYVWMKALSWPPLRLYFNVNGRRTRAGHKAPGSEPLIQILPTPMIISFHSANVIFIHSVEKLIVVRFWHALVQPNFKLIFVPQVVVWNGKHNSKCWSDVVDVVCDYSFYATWPVPRSFSCAVSQGFT